MAGRRAEGARLWQHAADGAISRCAHARRKRLARLRSRIVVRIGRAQRHASRGGGKLNAQTQRVFDDPGFREKFLAPNFIFSITNSPEAFAERIRSESAKWG